MEPLKYVKSVLITIGICATDNVGPFRKLLHEIIYLLITVMHLLNAYATTHYFLKYISVDYQGGLYALLAATVLYCGAYMLITLHAYRYVIQNSFATIEAIQRQSKSFHLPCFALPLDGVILFRFTDWNTKTFRDDSFANRAGRRITTFFITYYGPGYFIVFTIAALYNYSYCYAYDNIDINCLIMPYKYE